MAKCLLPLHMDLKSGKATVSRDDLKALGQIGMGLLCLAVFIAVGRQYLDGFALTLGSIRQPKPEFAAFLLFWMLFGGSSAGFLSVGITRILARMPLASSFTRRWRAISVQTWIMVGVAAGVLIPVIIRLIVLHDAPLTDDESVYRFQAQLLASGRLTGTSLPSELKLFLDRIFLINDGRMYAQYFVGWPALMAPGIWLGIPGFINALYAGLTVPALYGIVRRVVGPSWAPVGIVLFLTAPFLMVGAATGLSHTSCMAALAWFVWCVLRSRDDEASMWPHAGAAIFFSVAFFIRPTSALGVGLPFLVAWAVAVARGARSRRIGKILAFILPAAVFGVLFLVVNKNQNGSFLEVSYRHVFAYMQANDYRFAGRGPKPAYQFHNFDFTNWTKALASKGVALLRLNFALFGWPASLLFVPFARMRGLGALFGASAACFFAVHFFVDDIGIDSFGPVHFFEVSLPLLVLSVAGVQRLHRFGKEVDRRGNSAGYARGFFSMLVPVSVATLIGVGMVGYVPARFTALLRMTEAINRPAKTVAAAGLHHAIVFAPKPFAPDCARDAPRHFVFWRPDNDPDLTDDVLWVNHITIEDDTRFMDYFPERTGHVLYWTPECKPVLKPIEDVDPDEVPLGAIAEVRQAVNRGPDWRNAVAPEAFFRMRRTGGPPDQSR